MEIDWERAAQQMPRHAEFLRRQIVLTARAKRILEERERQRRDQSSEWLRGLWRNGTAKE